MNPELIAIRARMTGGKQVLAEGQTAAKGVAAPGAAAAASAAKTKSATAALSASLQKQSAMMRSVGRGMTTYVSLPMLAIGAVSGKMAVDFDRAMRNVNSIAQLPEPALQKLNDDVLALAGKTAQAPRTLAEGLYDLVSSGFNARESLGILEKSALAATAGLSTTEVSTKAVAAVLNAYRLPASEAGRVSDLLFRTVDRGVVTFHELAGTIGDVLPFAAQLSVGLDQVGAAMATMTKAGLSPAESSTRIKNVLVTLLKPGKDLSRLLREMGTTGEQLARRHGLQGALEQILSRTDGTKQAVAALFPNIRAMGGVLALTGLNARGAAEDLRGMGEASGATALALSQQSQSTAFKVQKAWARLQAALIAIGQEVLPIVTPPLVALASVLERALAWFSRLPGPIKSTAGGLMLMAAAAGPLLLLASSLLKVRLSLMLMSAAAGGAPAAGAGGKLIAGQMVGGIAKSIGPLAAAAGLGNIAISATEGDWKGAGFKAGGALVGGIAGFMLGGPAGAMIGGGAGSFLGGFLGDLFAGGRDLTAVQNRVAASSRNVARWQRDQRRASSTLTGAQDALSLAQRRAQTASRGVGAAERNLGAVRRRFGAWSQPALTAESQLIVAKNKHFRATKRLQNAERLQGVALAAYKTVTRQALAADKEHIVGLRQLVREKTRNFNAARWSNASSAKQARAARAVLTAQGQLSGAQRNYAKTLLDAAQKAGPNWAKAQSRMSATMLRFGGRLSDFTPKLNRLGRNPAPEQLADAFADMDKRLAPILRRSQRQIDALHRRIDSLGSLSLPDPGFGLPRTRPPRRTPRGAAGFSNFAGGMAWVGERGPELAFLPRGSDLMPAEPSRRFMSDPPAAPRRDRVIWKQKVEFKVGRRVLAEGVIEEQDDEEARY
jgi:TP901 family phage tail tape measure protein